MSFQRPPGSGDGDGDFSGDDEPSEEAALLPNKPATPPAAAEAYPSHGGKVDVVTMTRHVPWTTVVLSVLLFVLYLSIWTLPAPSFVAKLRLLRQSWHLSEVLQEPPKLKKELEVKQKDASAIKAKVAQVKATNDALQARVDAAENITGTLKHQLEGVRSESLKLKGQDNALRKKLDEVRKGQAEYEQKLKKLKELEMPLLDSIPEGDPA
eukprot:TRINITY_DN122238_c0_g1_i1.p1 TRINITY_DN122238_c0_g1~~TRINITY_DN122238_c0_g1_i1.p1  ORF type:complete len:210 (+),score=76.54 TRINITY_DN122238_c0_g1_i1:92-721(+)